MEGEQDQPKVGEADKGGNRSTFIKTVADQEFKKPRKNAFIFIFVTVLISMTGFGVVIPVMPDLVMDITGEGRAIAARWGGIITASYAAMQFLFSPILGALSDRFGRRPVLLGSLAMYAFDFLLLAVAPTLGLLLIARILSGMFSATVTTANACIADISPPEKRAANFGAMGAAFGLGFIIGPLVGGIVGELYGTRAPFFLVACIGAANFVYGFFFLPETLAPKNRRIFEWKRANAFGTLVQLGRYPAVLPIAIAFFIFSVGHWVLPSVWAYFVGEQFGWGPKEIAYSLAFVGLAAAIVQGGLSRIIIPKLGEVRSTIASLSIALIVMPIYAFATKDWMIYATIPFGALVGLATPAIQGMMSRALPANEQGELQGAIASVNGLSMIIGPFVMTLTFSAFTAPNTPIAFGDIIINRSGAPIYFPGAPFILAAALIAVSLFVFAQSAKMIVKESHSSPSTSE
ncbi:MAG: TCR/Tet family MFS transporter [Pseudomonadota bacterium]